MNLRRYLLAGLAVSIPILATVAVVRWLVEVADQALLLLPARYHPEQLLGMHLPGLGVLLSLVLLVVIGMLATNFVGKRLLAWFDALLAKVPVVRSIYGAVKQLMEAVLGKGGKAFRKVVLVSFPQPGQWTIGFITSDADYPFPDRDTVSRVAVFVPTTPNPTSGWMLFVDPAELIELDMTVEDGMKIVVSGGMLSPKRAADA